MNELGYVLYLKYVKEAGILLINLNFSTSYFMCDLIGEGTLNLIGF